MTNIKLSNRSNIVLFLTILILSVATSCAFAQEPKTTIRYMAKIGDLVPGQVEKTKLIDAAQISIIDEFAKEYSICSFHFTLVRLGEKPKELINADNGNFTPEMIALMQQTIPGDKIYFEYIKSKNIKSGNTITQNAISFVIQ